MDVELVSFLTMEHSSASGEEGISSSSGTEIAVLSPPRPSPPPRRRRPIPSKGHTKSRKGCFNCKRRKVKCEEALPECNQCKRLGLFCQYPNPNIKGKSTIVTTVAAAQPPSGPLTSISSVVPGVFNMKDLRFFHHFMVAAHPPLPLGAKAIWRETAAIAHGYEYLAHAVLGLGASHLTQCGNVDYSAQALSHRVMAIRLVNEQLSRPSGNKVDSDALLAALLLLMHQASFMDDMVEFLTMTRGCTLVASTIVPNFSESRFRTFTSHLERMKKSLLIKKTDHQDTQKDEQQITAFITSLQQLHPLCNPNTPEHKCLTSLLHIVGIASPPNDNTSPLLPPPPPTQRFNISHLCAAPCEMTQQEYAQFTSAQNQTARLLLVHMFLLEALLNGILFRGEQQRASRRVRDRVVLSWVRGAYRSMPPQYSKYMAWPLAYSRVLEEQVGL